MRTRDIKSKRPFRRIRPDGYISHGRFSSLGNAEMPSDVINFDIVTQADFLREFYPTGHAINDPTIYPDIWREEDIPVLDESGNDTGKNTRRLYKELVPRYAFAFQQIITVKHLVHLCGNDVQFELNSTKTTEKENEDFAIYRTGWLKKDMEIAFYESAKSVKVTGDSAFVGYLRDGEYYWKTLSYLNGDTLYPHYDSVTGKINLFARAFRDYNENGDILTEWLEVWDNTYLYRYRQGSEGNKTLKERLLGIFGINGYILISKKPHGFPFIPVAYKRDDNGACWSMSQDTIDGYEMSFSQMAHNNQAYGEPILVFQGEGDNLDALKDVNGTIKSLSMTAEDKASYLQAQSASDSYMKQLDTQYKMIFSQSFIVDPPELKSGDLPAAALKILYSPAYEKAMNDCLEYQSFLNDMVKIFSYGYGVEMKKTIDFTNLSMKWWLEPYVHVNSSTVIADLASAVVNGFISRQTASERIETLYATNAEWDRILREKKEEGERELLNQIKLQEAKTKNASNSNSSSSQTTKKE